jgi:hypothetical protein
MASGSGSIVGVGFVLVIVAGLLHLMAHRNPERYGLNGFAWVLTMIAVLLALVVAVGGASGR